MARRTVELWEVAPGLNAWMIVCTRWTPVVMLGLIFLAAIGVGLAPNLHRQALVHAWIAVGAAVLARIVNEPVARLFPRPRPFEVLGFRPLTEHAPGDGFPSNHTTGAFTLACAMAGIPGYHELLLMLACFLAASRIYTGLHYVIDVLAGALHGILTALLVVWVCALVGWT